MEHRPDRLLREMGRQAENKYEAIVEPIAAAQRLNTDPDSPETTKVAKAEELRGT